MWKLLVVSMLIGFAAHADKTAVTDEMGGEGQDSEKYAVARGNPKEGDPVDNGDPCLSGNSVKNFEKHSQESRTIVQRGARAPGQNGQSLRVIRLALQGGSLVPAGADLGTNAADAGPLLEKYGFVNLLKCPAWKKKLGEGEKAALPLGAILVYSPSDTNNKFGDIRMKTPEGCLGGGPKPVSDEELAQASSDAGQREVVKKILTEKAAIEHIKKAKCGKNPGYKLTGIYVKNVN